MTKLGTFFNCVGKIFFFVFNLSLANEFIRFWKLLLKYQFAFEKLRESTFYSSATRIRLIFSNVIIILPFLRSFIGSHPVWPGAYFGLEHTHFSPEKTLAQCLFRPETLRTQTTLANYTSARRPKFQKYRFSSVLAFHWLWVCLRVKQFPKF